MSIEQITNMSYDAVNDLRKREGRVTGSLIARFADRSTWQR